MKFPKRHIAENLCDLGLGKKKKIRYNTKNNR